MLLFLEVVAPFVALQLFVQRARLFEPRFQGKTTIPTENGSSLMPRRVLARTVGHSLGASTCAGSQPKPRARFCNRRKKWLVLFFPKRSTVRKSSAVVSTSFRARINSNALSRMARSYLDREFGLAR